jgi:hypothetical protein
VQQPLDSYIDFDLVTGMDPERISKTVINLNENVGVTNDSFLGTYQPMDAWYQFYQPDSVYRSQFTTSGRTIVDYQFQQSHVYL